MTADLPAGDFLKQVKVQTKHTFLHFSEEGVKGAPSPLLSACQRRSFSDFDAAKGEQKLFAKSPLISSPAGSPQMRAVDESGLDFLPPLDLGVHAEFDLFEDPTLRRLARSEGLPDVTPMTPSPLLRPSEKEIELMDSVPPFILDEAHDGLGPLFMTVDQLDDFACNWSNSPLYSAIPDGFDPSIIGGCSLGPDCLTVGGDGVWEQTMSPELNSWQCPDEVDPSAVVWDGSAQWEPVGGMCTAWVGPDGGGQCGQMSDQCAQMGVWSQQNSPCLGPCPGEIVWEAQEQGGGQGAAAAAEECVGWEGDGASCQASWDQPPGAEPEPNWEVDDGDVGGNTVVDEGAFGGDGGWEATPVDAGENALLSSAADLTEREAGAPEEPQPREQREGRKGKGRGRDREKNREERERDVGNDQRQPQEAYTTVMLRNIPNKYTREMLVDQLNKDYSGLFDFMYLPIDFKNKCNVGYSFINFRTTEACERFISRYHGIDVRRCLPGFNSRKVVEVTPARVQGLSENVRRLRNSPVMSQLQDHPEWLPLLFDENGDAEPFPQPDQPLPPVKTRGKPRDEQK